MSSVESNLPIKLHKQTDVYPIKVDMQEKGTIFKKTFLSEIHSFRLGSVGIKYRAISSQQKNHVTPLDPGL